MLAQSDGYHQIILTLRDIHEDKLKELREQQALQEAFDAAKAANMAKNEFLSRMSHDIRTPINGIRGMATLAKHHLGEDDKEEEYINKIITSTDYLLDLVNDVLQMNKLESGKIYLENKSFDMRMIVKETVELCKIQADKQDIRMNLKELHTEHAHLIGSPLHVRQIAQNLITNAIRYNRAGGTIEFTSKKGEGTTFVVTIAMTANAFIEDINQSREVGMNEHFSKPLNMENVIKTICKYKKK